MMTKGSPIMLTILVLSLYSGESWCQVSCKDEDNKPVDWFIGLKYPKSYDFVYLTPGSSQWKKSQSNISSNTNMVAQTLEQSYDNQHLSVYYNDAQPESDPIYSERGHLKGIVNFGVTSGYWLIHSVPKFPTPGKYIYKKGESIYGQSFICVTLTTPNLASIVDQLLMMQSTVYSSNVPEKFSQDPTLKKKLDNLVNNDNTDTDQPKSRIVGLKSLGQLPFIHFGKSGSFGDDLYASLIAPRLQASLSVETWIRGERIPSSCQTSFKVFNVRKVQLVAKSFKESKDHSKWAVSTSEEKPFVCIGDINRMTSQFERGGGSMCVSNVAIWKVFSAIVADSEKCKLFSQYYPDCL